MQRFKVDSSELQTRWGPSTFVITTIIINLLKIEAVKQNIFEYPTETWFKIGFGKSSWYGNGVVEQTVGMQPFWNSLTKDVNINNMYMALVNAQSFTKTGNLWWKFQNSIVIQED